MSKKTQAATGNNPYTHPYTPAEWVHECYLHYQDGCRNNADNVEARYQQWQRALKAMDDVVASLDELVKSGHTLAATSSMMDRARASLAALKKEEPTDAALTNHERLVVGVVRALAVIAKTPTIALWLEQNDPKALEQANAALAAWAADK